MDSQNKAMAMMNCSLDSNMNLLGGTNNPLGSTTNALYRDGGLNCWGYWQDHYYPSVIRESYPVYIQERAKDKGKQAFEIVKILKDKKLVTLAKVGDFIDLMDELIKIL